MKRILLLVLSGVFFCFGSASAVPIELISENFGGTYTSGDASPPIFGHDKIHFNIDTTDPGGGFSLIGYNQYFASNDNVRVELDYSNFFFSGDVWGQFQVGFTGFSGDVVKAVRMYNIWDGDYYTAYHYPGFPQVTNMPTLDSSGTFVVEKSGDDITLSVEGVPGAEWTFLDINLGDYFVLQIDASVYQGAGAIRVDVDRLDITVTPAPVPEPTTMILFVTGLVGLAGIRRKEN